MRDFYTEKKVFSNWLARLFENLDKDPIPIFNTFNPTEVSTMLSLQIQRMKEEIFISVNIGLC